MNNVKLPWYQEPYVWLIILFPATAVVGGLITLNIAIIFKDDLVIDDYYKQGIEINRTLAREQTAAHYGLQVKLQIDQDRPLIDLYLTSSQPNYPKPEQLSLNFRHRAHASLDQQLVLPRVADTLYQARLPELVKGHWEIEVATPEWRLVKSVSIPLATKEVTMVPVPQTFR